MKTKKITCIVCPRGCEIDVQYDNSGIKSINGYSCKRGIDYATEEVLEPKRIITSTVKVVNGQRPVVSVKTNKPVKKELIEKCMGKIYEVEINAPIHIGDVIIKNILNTDADIVATGECDYVPPKVIHQ